MKLASKWKELENGRDRSGRDQVVGDNNRGREYGERCLELEIILRVVWKCKFLQ